jgi:hypothetical protein
MKKRPTLYTKSEDITMDQSYNIVRSVISWCQENLSPPVIKRRSVMKVMVFRETGGDYGYYCDQNNWLVINLDVTPNIRMLIRSTIHEYTHSLQNMKEYSLMNKQVGYDSNPFEVEANNSEKKYYKECWSEIKKHYKKW